MTGQNVKNWQPFFVIARHDGAEAISWWGMGLPRFARNDTPDMKS
jgi:hypothetical protein